MSIKSFFKDKIDWVLYNYMLYVITEYEDSGFNLKLGVHVKNPYGLYIRICGDLLLHHTLEGFNENVSLSVTCDYYNSYGLYYIIRIDAVTNNDIVENMFVKISRKIQNKFGDIYPMDIHIESRELTIKRSK